MARSPQDAAPAPDGPAADTARLEGMVLAHRRILSLLLARHADAALLDELDSRSVMHDHQEDPGAVPSEALAILATEAEEYRQIAEEVRRIADLPHDGSE